MKKLEKYEISYLMRAAKKIEKYDFESAMHLTKIAYDAVPHVDYICKKWASYKRFMQSPTYDPSIEDYVPTTDRLNFYLGNSLSYNKTSIKNHIESKEFTRDKIIEYKLYDSKEIGEFLYFYTQDMDEILDSVDLKNKVLVVFGDRMLRNVKAPVFLKARYSDEKNGGILLKLKKKRHFSLFTDIVEWDDKLDAPVWRGVTTGSKSQNNTRFRIVSTYAHKYNVGFTQIVKNTEFWNGVLTDNHHLCMREPLSIFEQLKYKYILSIEGNDVATNLKWILASNSLVIMKPPTRDTWLMESKLRPFVHYVPLNENVDNLDDVITWCRQNDTKCKQIVKNANNYMNMFLDVNNEVSLHKMIAQKYIESYV